jgi:hypothetical protein
MARNWLEPPEWWKKHKPLRWLLVFAILLFAYAKFDDWRDSRPIAASPEAAGTQQATPTPAEAKPQVAATVESDKETPPPPVEPVLEPVPPPDPMARYTQVETKRVSLMTQRGYSAQLTTQERKSRRNYPPHRVDVLEVTEFKHLGNAGKLKLEFFNDRLYEVYFEPAKAGDYLYKLRKKTRLKRNESGRTEHVQGHLRVASNIDLAESEVGKALKVSPFILWQDLRLIQQLKNWGPIR